MPRQPKIRTLEELTAYPTDIKPKVKRKRQVYRYSRKRIPRKEITPETTGIIAKQIAKNNLSQHQKKRLNYTGKFNLDALAKVIHTNHTPEIHSSIMDNNTQITYANLYYGAREVRIETDGNIMAVFLHCTNIPRNVSSPKGWKFITGNNRIVLYTENDNLISGKFRLFRYGSHLRVIKAFVIGAEEVMHEASVNVEGVDYWIYLKGNWETLTPVSWENYKVTF